LANVNSEGLLIAAGQNLKRFLAATGWGRRNAPCGSLLALPWEPWRLVMAFDMMADQIRTVSWDSRFLATVLTAKGFFNK
jgi:hypothetical protein